MDALECRRRMVAGRKNGYVKVNKTYVLIPSKIESQEQYAVISDEANGCTGVDSDTYATATNGGNKNTVHIWLRGFNADQIPNTAIIQSVSAQIKISRSSTTYSALRPQMALATGVILLNADSSVSTSVGTISFSNYFTVQQFIRMKNSGDFYINCNLYPAGSSNTDAAFYIYGAEIEVHTEEWVPLTPHTVRLIPSAVAKQQNVSATAITNGSNMLTDTDSDTYGVATNTIGSTYSIRLYGFNFSSVPSGAIVTNYVLKVKLYENGWRRTAGSNIVNCYNGGNTYIANSSIPATDLPVGTTPTIISKQKFTDWNTLCNYSDFRVCIALSKQTDLDQCAVYIYGCEIEVTYLSAD